MQPYEGNSGGEYDRTRPARASLVLMVDHGTRLVRWAPPDDPALMQLRYQWMRSNQTGLR